MKIKTQLKTLIAFSFLSIIGAISAEETKQLSPELEKGKQLAFDRKKGNCLACHFIPGGTLMGTSGPGLIAMKQRFPDPEVLTAQIADARTKNKHSIMPPFGAHGILSEEEIKLVVNWLYTF